MVSQKTGPERPLKLGSPKSPNPWSYIDLLGILWNFCVVCLNAPNERTHQLQRQIRKAGSGSTRGRRDEELSAQSHCLALCTNLVMAYNTSCLQRTLDAWRKTSGREIDPAILRFISPMGFGHINFNGVIVFPFEHYRAQLLAAARGFRARSP